MPCGRHVVDAPCGPRVTAQHAAHRKPRAAQSSVPRYRGDRVARARRVVPAGRRGEWRDEALVEPQQPKDDQTRKAHDPTRGSLHRATSNFRVTRRRRESYCSASSPNDDVAAAGNARTTSRAPAGRSPRPCPTTARSRRLTRFLVTAFPTPLETTKPTFAFPSPGARWTTIASRPARAPPRMACRNSAERRMRFWAGSTPQVRQRARRDPCDDEPRGWRGQRACACAGGSHGSWRGADCSAGRSACSRVSPIAVVLRTHRACDAGLWTPPDQPNRPPNVGRTTGTGDRLGNGTLRARGRSNGGCTLAHSTRDA